MIIWLTPKYSKAAPEMREAVSADAARVTFADGWTYYGYKEGVFWHRKYAAAAKVARANREAWLKELTTKAAEVATLPPIAEKAA